MQIYPNVYEIKSVFGNRYVQQYLFVGERTVLLDAGVAHTPETTIFPYLEKLGISPRQISMVVAMHADADHHGGLPAIKDASRSTLLACHKEDLRLIEDPEYLYQFRYNFLARDHKLGFGREGMVNCPQGRRIDALLSAGDVIEVSRGWNLRIWHVPGHSAGHLAAYDERNHAAFTSDAVQANGYPTTDGKMAFGPTYYTVDSYLATIRYLEKTPIEHIFSGHWPSVHGRDVGRFLHASRDFVETAEDLIRTYFRRSREPVTLRTLITQLSPRLGPWPDEMADFLQFAIYGHVVRLQQNGILRASRSVPIEYSLA